MPSLSLILEWVIYPSWFNTGCKKKKERISCANTLGLDIRFGIQRKKKTGSVWVFQDPCARLITKKLDLRWAEFSSWPCNFSLWRFVNHAFVIKGEEEHLVLLRGLTGVIWPPCFSVSWAAVSQDGVCVYVCACAGIWVWEGSVADSCYWP